MKKKILFWGAGDAFEYIQSFFREEAVEIVGVVDKNKTGVIDCIKIYDPKRVSDIEFDFLMISSVDFADSIYEEAIKAGVPQEKILYPMMTRGQMIKCWSILSEEGLQKINFLKSDETLKHLNRINKYTIATSKRLSAVIDMYRKSKNLDFLKRTYEEVAAKFVTEQFLNSNSVDGRKVIFDDRISYREYISNILAEKEGLFLEFGVFQGRSINQMSELLPHKSFYGFDSFEGLPEDWHTGYKKGRFNLDGNMPLCNSNVTLVKGWFEDTMPAFLKVHDEKVAWLHIDCDLYVSAKYVLDMLRDRIVPGTIIMFDEFIGHIGSEYDEKKAFEEFIAETKHRYNYLACSSVWNEHGTYVALAVEIVE